MSVKSSPLHLKIPPTQSNTVRAGVEGKLPSSTISQPPPEIFLEKLFSALRTFEGLRVQMGWKVALTMVHSYC